MFPDYDQECWKVQLKVTKEPIERVNILVCDHEEADTLLRYISSMQLNIEIRESVWFLETHVMVLGASNSDQNSYLRDIPIYPAIGAPVYAALPGLYWLLYSRCVRW